MNDRQLSPHFSLFELTRTDHSEFQEENRHVTQEEETKLRELANLGEAIIVILGCNVDKHSGKRCLALNRFLGSSDSSQHVKCEGLDFSPEGPDTEATVTDAWQKIVTAVRAQRKPGYVGTGVLKFGQLLLESCKDKREGRVWWIHVSLGAPYRDAKKCGQIATLIDGKFTLIARIP